MMTRRVRLWSFILACSLGLHAEVVLPQLFQDGMVMQRGKPVPVWGKAGVGETVVVTLNKKKFQTVAGADGRWRVDLPAMKAGGPYRMTVNETAIDSVFIGDVWLCSGQSNIDVTIERVYPWYTKEIDGYANPQVRLFRVMNDVDTHGVRDDIRPSSISWEPVTKQQAWRFSAVGYFLGRRMYERTHVPQGIIVNSWGGTPVEAWVSADSLQQEFPLLVERTRLYQNDDYVATQQRANGLMARQWDRQLMEADPGIQGGFMRLDCDDSSWQDVDQYAVEWAKKDGCDIIGSIWLRQHVQVDKAHAGQPARLLLGTLYDADVTYVNGQQVGSTGYQYPPRRYDIPKGLLREGDNVIAIRFINKRGTVHFIKEKSYLLAFGEDRFSLNPLPEDVIPLSRTWKHHVGAEMPDCPSVDVSLQYLPTTLYNAVLHPLAPYALSGVVWYQGESNTDNPSPYERLLTMMIGNWRTLWKQPELPFVVVQLANFMEPSDVPQESNWAVLREAQRKVAGKMENVALASAIDLGETVDIHPLRKREIAERIGLCFDRMVYGDKKAPLMPEIMDVGVVENQITLTYDQPLREESSLFEFEVAGADGRFHRASASSKNSTIVIMSSVSAPTRVRHAWKDNPIRLNAYARSGLPVGPFELQLP